MDIVVDANVLFASIIKHGPNARLMLDERLHMFAPEFLVEEFSKHESIILSKTKRSKEQFDEILSILEQIITFVPKEEFKEDLKFAKEISPDPDDATYLALALKLHCPIWSNDKQLKNQQIIKVYTTEELSKLMRF